MTVLTRPTLELDAAPALLATVGAGAEVPLVDGRSARYVHLDSAASAPALQAVADHVAEVLPYYASVHRGAGYRSQVCTSLYEDARGTVAGFVGARPDDVVVFLRNTTDALNLLSTAVPGEVVVLDVEHHANLLPWQRGDARVVPAADTLAATEAALTAELARRPAALLAVTGASNVTGEVPDLARLAAIAHAAGARVVIDGAQLVPHRALDLAALDLDYLAFSGHKLYAPFGAGALVGRGDWLDQAPPHLAGGGAVREVSVAATTWATGPERHEGGTPNVLGVAALAAACRVLGVAGDELRTHEAVLHAQLVDGLRERGIEPLRIWSDAVDVVGVVSFTVPGHPAAQVAAYLSAEHGIGVRDGRFCAHPLVARLGVAAGAVRASLGVGSSGTDVQRLLDALDELLTDGPRWTYFADRGGCTPFPDPRPATPWSADGRRLDHAPSAPAPCATPSPGGTR